MIKRATVSICLLLSMVGVLHAEQKRTKRWR